METKYTSYVMKKVINVHRVSLGLLNDKLWGKNRSSILRNYIRGLSSLKKKKKTWNLSKENLHLTSRNHKRANSVLSSYFVNLHNINICSHQKYLQAMWQLSTSHWLLLWVRCPAFVCALKTLFFNTSLIFWTSTTHMTIHFHHQSNNMENQSIFSSIFLSKSFSLHNIWIESFKLHYRFSIYLWFISGLVQQCTVMCLK